MEAAEVSADAAEDTKEAVEDAQEAAEDAGAEYEELEPRLKYHRVGHSNTDLVRILNKDFITCLAVHSKFITVGTNWGHIYILDHMGNNIEGRPLPGHSTTVNQLSVDEKGEFLASCSMDERIIIHNIFSKKTHFTQKLDKPILSVAISPQFSSNQSFVTGDDRLILVEPGFLKKQFRVLGEGRSPVRSIVWSGSLIAWANDLGVKVHCLQERRAVTNLPRPEAESDTSCCVQPVGASSFVVAWRSVVKICEIVAERATGRRIGQITAHFAFPLAVCGVCPFGRQLLLLSHREAEKPQLHLLEPRYDSYDELSIEELKVRGYERYSAANYRFEHLRGDSMYFVVCPKDIICAQERDRDDHIQWLLSKQRYKEALDDVTANGHTGRYSVASVGREYIDFLLRAASFEEAADLCGRVLDVSRQNWEAMVQRFHASGSARSLARVLPTELPRLSKEVYDLVLREVLKADSGQFYSLVSSWPPAAFSVEAATKEVRDRLSRSPADETLNKCQAKLFELAGKHEETLAILLKLEDQTVFELVQRHKLYDLVLDKLKLLFHIDRGRALALLLDQDRLSIDRIVAQLAAHSQLQCEYLDAQYAKDPARVQKHYDRMVALYAEHAPLKLLPFLRSATGFSLESALELCKDRQLTDETVFLLARVGRRLEALDLLLDSRKYERVVQFCREESDPQLWRAAVENSRSRPQLITALLHNSGSEVDPSLLIQRIDSGLVVPDLRNSIVKLLSDYRVGIALTEGCDTILSKDCDALVAKQIRAARRPLRVDPAADACMRCRSSLLQPRSRQQLAAAQFAIFHCGHSFHLDCVDAHDADQLRCPACAGLC